MKKVAVKFTSYLQLLSFVKVIDVKDWENRNCEINKADTLLISSLTEKEIEIAQNAFQAPVQFINL